MTDTPNLGLHTWAAEDPVDVTEVNENFTLLDQNCTTLSQSISSLTTAVGSGGHSCRIASGSYTGNGQYGASHPNTISFDFRPMVVFLRSSDDQNSQLTTVFLRGSTVCNSPDEYLLQMTWSNSSISWYNANAASYQCNQNGQHYQYIVLGYTM